MLGGTQILTVLYYNGEAYRHPDEGMTYRNAEPTCFWWYRGGSVEELVQCIRNVTGWTESEGSVRIQARYALWNSPRPFFELVDIFDDNSLRNMENDCCSPHTYCRSLQLFVKLVPLNDLSILGPFQFRSSSGSNSAPTERYLMPRRGNEGPPIPNPANVPTDPTVTLPETYHSFPSHELLVSAPSIDHLQVHGSYQLVEPQVLQPSNGREPFIEENTPGFEFDGSENVANFDICVMTDNMNDPATEEEQDYLSEDEEPHGPVHNMSSLACHTVSVNEFESGEWIDDTIMSGIPNIGLSAAPSLIEVGKIFQTKNEMQHAIIRWTVGEHRSYKVVSSSSTRYSLRCKQHKHQGCPWYLHAIVPHNKQHFVIKKLIGEHTCLNPTLENVHEQITAKFIAGHILGVVRADIGTTPGVIKAQMEDLYKYNVTYKKAWHAKQIALKALFGSFKESYARLPVFLNAIRQSNPGTIVKFHFETNSDGVNTFLKVFWSFKPCIEAIEHCRPVMSIDGTHLYGKYTGTLLIATCVDGSNQLLPFAFAIVYRESNETWHWFLNCIRRYVSPSRVWCVISDRHAGIKNVMKSHERWVEPYAYHRYCARHFGANAQKSFTKMWSNKVKEICYQNQEKKYKFLMENVKEKNKGLYKWLKHVPLEKWAYYADGGKRWGMMTTNSSEVFNNVLKESRYLPVTNIVELTFYRLNKYFVTRRDKVDADVNRQGRYPDVIRRKLVARREKSLSHTCTLFDRVRNIWQVTTKSRLVNGQQQGSNVHIVNLSMHQCSCNKPTLEHLPCSHVMAVCGCRSLSYDSFVSEYYTLEKCAKVWESRFNPIPDKAYWDTDVETKNLVPDENAKKTKKGRPQTSRRHNEMDIGESSKTKTDRCGKCREVGHNRRTCPN